jgi:hypothetical protein
MFSTLYAVPGHGVAFAFRFGKIPDKSFSKSEIPGIFSEELARISGIRTPEKDVQLFWDVQPHMKCEDYSEVRVFFWITGYWHAFISPEHAFLARAGEFTFPKHLMKSARSFIE